MTNSASVETLNLPGDLFWRGHTDRYTHVRMDLFGVGKRSVTVNGSALVFRGGGVLKLYRQERGRG